MSADNITTLAEVAIEVLERHAFLLGEPQAAAGGPLLLAEPSWIVTLPFTGPRSAGIGMVVAPNLARQAAANLYAEALTAVSDEQAQDAAKELLNIVCGSYLHRVEGDEAVFDLNAPALRVATREAAAQCVSSKPQAALAVEGHPLLLFLEL